MLARLADIAGWMSDAELADLACILGREAGGQGRARVGLVATRQEQLAVLAREAGAILPQLGDGLLTVRPGIFAADNPDGRVTLLLSGAQPPEQTPDDLTSAVTASLDTLRWLESLGVMATGAVGHGLGALAGLAWAGVLGESEVVEIAELRAQYLSRSTAKEAADEVPAAATPDSGGRHAARSATARPSAAAAAAAAARPGAAGLRSAIAQRFRFGPPRRRLISTTTGVELDSVDAAIDLICSGFAGADKLSDAITTGALGATLMLETGPGRTLVSAAAAISRVPAISLQSGYEDPMNRARAAAALFAAGALTEPHALFAGRQTRPVDIWREQVFITSPCEMVPHPTLAFDQDPASLPRPARPTLARSTLARSTLARSTPASTRPEQSRTPQPTWPTRHLSPSRRPPRMLSPNTQLPNTQLPNPHTAAEHTGAEHTGAEDDGLASVRDEIERRLPARPLISAASGTGPEQAGAHPPASPAAEQALAATESADEATQLAEPPVVPDGTVLAAETVLATETVLADRDCAGSRA